jgi:hypothetical protein
LPNSHLTYINKESWEKQNYVCDLPPLGNLHQESFSILYFFFHPPTYTETVTDGNHDPRARGGESCQVQTVGVATKLLMHMRTCQQTWTRI